MAILILRDFFLPFHIDKYFPSTPMGGYKLKKSWLAVQINKVNSQAMASSRDSLNFAQNSSTVHVWSTKNTTLRFPTRTIDLSKDRY